MRVITMKPTEQPNVVEWPDGAQTYPLIRDTIGNGIDTALRIQSPHVGRSIDCYCDDEFLYNGSALNFIRPWDRSPIGGTVVFIAGIESNGNSAGLTEQEIVAVWEFLKTVQRPKNIIILEME